MISFPEKEFICNNLICFPITLDLVLVFHFSFDPMQHVVSSLKSLRFFYIILEGLCSADHDLENE
jgi:hypothetical protein